MLCKPEIMQHVAQTYGKFLVHVLDDTPGLHLGTVKRGYDED